MLANLPPVPPHTALGVGKLRMNVATDRWARKRVILLCLTLPVRYPYAGPTWNTVLPTDPVGTVTYSDGGHPAAALASSHANLPFS